MSAPRRCTACGEDVEPDDGGAIWYHPGNMSAFCDGDDDPDLTRQATPAPILTRTQLDALADLHRTGHQWPLMHPRYGGDRYTSTTRYAERTLDALADAGAAAWARGGRGVLSHIVPALAAWADGFGAWHVAVPADIDNGAAVARAVIRGEVWARIATREPLYARPVRVELDTVSAPRDGFTIYREV